MDPVRLVVDALTTTAYVAGPLLLAALVSGVIVGLFQAVVQVNEASLSFLVKLVSVCLVLLGLGSTLGGNLVGYARRSFSSIERVVR